MTSTGSGLLSRRRVVTVLVAAVLALVVVVALVASLGRPARVDPPASGDAAVLVTDVSFEQRSTGYTVTSVEAVTRGDDGFVRLHLTWSDDPDDSAQVRYLPGFAAEVLHREPYAGASAACGLSGPSTVPVDSPPATVELPCSGLLVPASVAKVTLRD